MLYLRCELRATIQSRDVPRLVGTELPFGHEMGLNYLGPQEEENQVVPHKENIVYVSIR